MVAKGNTWAGKPNQKFLCVINHLYDIFIDIFLDALANKVTFIFSVFHKIKILDKNALLGGTFQLKILKTAILQN